MSEPSQPIQSKKRIKVVLLGDRSVGKSSIINRFITDHFEQNLQPTVGVDFMGKNIKYKGNNYRIQLWDTAGQEKYRSLVKGYLKGADACVLVYDCTSISSYASLPEWLGLFESVSTQDAYKIIIANKCDAEFNPNLLQQSKKTIKSTHENLRQIPQIVSSAKLDINICIIFEQIMHNFVMRKSRVQNFSHFRIDVGANFQRVLGGIGDGCCK